MSKIKRMWVNQPSTLQPYHKQHGEKVLAEFRRDNNKYIRVYFTRGRLVSMKMHKSALSEGWPGED